MVCCKTIWSINCDKFSTSTLRYKVIFLYFDKKKAVYAKIINRAYCLFLDNTMNYFLSKVRKLIFPRALKRYISEALKVDIRVICHPCQNQINMKCTH